MQQQRMVRHLFTLPSHRPWWLWLLLLAVPFIASSSYQFVGSMSMKAEPLPTEVVPPPPPPAPDNNLGMGGPAPPESAPQAPESSVPRYHRRSHAQYEKERLENSIKQFGMMFCALAALLSALVLITSLPIFLFSNNSERAERAGGLVKTTLGFFIGSGGVLLGTIIL